MGHEADTPPYTCLGCKGVGSEEATRRPTYQTHVSFEDGGDLFEHARALGKATADVDENTARESVSSKPRGFPWWLQ